MRLSSFIYFSHYRPQTKLRKGNVFISVWKEFCPRGKVYTLGPTPPTQADTPHQTATAADGTHLLECILVFYIITVVNYGDSLSATTSLLIGKWIDNRVNHSRMCCHLVHRSHEVWMTLCSVYSHVNETVQWVTYFGSLQRSLEIKSWASSEISSKRSSGNSRFTWNKNVCIVALVRM